MQEVQLEETEEHVEQLAEQASHVKEVRLA
jgi:hypothetical protein